MHADLGFKDHLALDPKFEPLLSARREAARLMGDVMPAR
jgi:hypothetical protein